VKLGLTIFPTDYSIAPGELAAAAEERGFESLWFPEHSHIPLSRKSPYPGGGDLPKMYYDVMEPFVALAVAAAATRTLKVGTGVCLVPQRDPIQTAKSVATLDLLSGGRFLFGVGAGWNQDEMEDHGTAFADRGAVMRERILAMKALWTASKAEYHGKHVDFGPAMTWPKPVQKPHPPIHVGGGWPHAARRAIEYGDGWSPIHGFGDLAGKLPEFRKRATDAGRDLAGLSVTIFGLPGKAATIAPYRDAGAERAVLGLPPAPRDEILPLLDRYARVAGAL
jgi:probable F420-dependent oxidoreductase